MLLSHHQIPVPSTSNVSTQPTSSEDTTSHSRSSAHRGHISMVELHSAKPHVVAPSDHDDDEQTRSHKKHLRSNGPSIPSIQISKSKLKIRSKSKAKTTKTKSP